MTWTSAPNDLPITAKMPYKSTLNNVIGRVPVSSSISFDWLEFMVATVKASHLGYVAPDAVSHAGSEGIRYDRGSVLFHDIERERARPGN